MLLPLFNVTFAALQVTDPNWKHHCRFQKDLLTVNLDSVSQRIQEGRLDNSSVITMQTLREAGLLGKKVSSGVKLLGRVSLTSHANVAVCACYV